MRTLQLNMKVTALSSITHNGCESMGTETKFRRVKIIAADGNEAEVPEVSGNAMRGLLRDLVHSHLCRLLGYCEDGQGLTLPAFHFLFSGGSLNSSSLGIDSGYYARMRSLIPSVSVWGGGVGNALLPGKLKCGSLVLVCAENRDRLSAPLNDHPNIMRTCWSYLSQEMNTRKDDSKNPHRQELMEPRVRMLLNAAQDEKKKKKAAGEDQADAPGVATQMMYHTEALCAGSVFSWRVTLEDVTDVEWEAFLVALAELMRKPWIGGKSGTGHGEVSIQCENWSEINQRIAPDQQAIGAPLCSAYEEHIRTKSESIKTILGEMK